MVKDSYTSSIIAAVGHMAEHSAIRAVDNARGSEMAYVGWRVLCLIVCLTSWAAAPAVAQARAPADAKAFSPSAEAPTLPFDHVHVGVQDPARAVEWYVNYLGAKPGEAPRPRGVR